MYGDKLKEGKKHSQKLLIIGALEKISLFRLEYKKNPNMHFANETIYKNVSW